MNELETNIYFWIWSFKELKTLSNTLLKEDLDEEEYWNVRWLCVSHERNIICYIIEENTDKKDYRWVLLHEIIHWVHYILDYIWHGLTYDEWTEILAYYTVYYIKQWLEFLDYVKKKDAKSKSNRKWLKGVSKTTMWGIHQSDVIPKTSNSV